MSGAWDEWERLRSSDDPDPIDVLKAVSTFQRYFAAVETEAVRAARAKGHSWAQIRSVLGRATRLPWRRTDVPAAVEGWEERWEATKRDPDAWWAHTDELPV